MQQTYRFPPGLLPCSEPTAFPPASYRAANLPLSPRPLTVQQTYRFPPGLLPCSEPTVLALRFEPPRLK
ncbi:hypothetical protein ASA_P4G046 (plasmid) [Aeromonas salmonicida subsp. salmonicida A449]|uniref:Uncharacterized protein n=1 Tax=Aeromonas salmonicida (strain A449) TaxID=382245 RepID=A4STX7_AERS4|nr:hypothetical protein ASA_P4G046 [Aeromonas salmonicida subsp. salmonicida A449]